MADYSLEELREILLGADALGGSALLLEVAPLLPESLLDRAMSVADRIPDFGQCLHVQTALAQRLSPTERQERLATLARLKAETPGTESGEESLDKALAAAPQILRSLENIPEEERALLLAEFLNYLSGKLSTTSGGKKAKPPVHQVIDPTDEASAGSTRPRRKTRGLDEGRIVGGGRKKGGGSKGGGTRSIGGGTKGGSKGGSARKKRNGGGTREWVAPKAKRKVAPASRRIVNTGFAGNTTPHKPLTPEDPLASGQDYFFWLEVGKRKRKSIEEKAVALPTDRVPEGARLKVALFNFDGGLILTPGEDIGELEVQADGTVKVSEAVKTSQLTLPPKYSRLKETTLFFPVRASSSAGVYRLRCCIYYQQFLVQSRIVTARVMRSPHKVEKALNSKVDYTLSRTLSPAHLTQMEPHKLSIMINGNGDGSHGFSFMGAGNFEKDNVAIPGQELQDLIMQARDAYALAAWGAKNPWNDQNYRYDQSPQDNIAQIKGDLVRFAIRGYNIYDAIVNKLAGGKAKADDLKELMRAPGLLQIALKESPSFILPAALLYDYPLFVDADAFTLCQSFMAALNAAAPLEETDCFKGNCPTKDEDTIICPSGFWGYRHNLGLPLSVADAPDAPTEITWQTKPSLTVAVSTDENFKRRKTHIESIRALRPDIEWNYGETRDDVLRELKESKPHLVYFYCHGGISETRPYLQVGARDPSGNISPSNLRAKKIFWDTPRPLVFINGCHTVAVEPEKAIEFISAFIETADAAGVIGTEITIFEPLATAFAEDCLRRFLSGTPIGESVRNARLKLLKDGNPLGLVYIPYVMANLRLVQQSA